MRAIEQARAICPRGGVSQLLFARLFDSTVMFHQRLDRLAATHGIADANGAGLGFASRHGVEFFPARFVSTIERIRHFGLATDDARQT